MAQDKKDTSTGDLLDLPPTLSRFYVRKIGVMSTVIDKSTLTVYQVQPKDAAALCELLNNLDVRSTL